MNKVHLGDIGLVIVFFNIADADMMSYKSSLKLAGKNLDQLQLTDGVYNSISRIVFLEHQSVLQYVLLCGETRTESVTIIRYGQNSLLSTYM